MFGNDLGGNCLQGNAFLVTILGYDWLVHKMWFEFPVQIARNDFEVRAQVTSSSYEFELRERETISRLTCKLGFRG